MAGLNSTNVIDVCEFASGSSLPTWVAAVQVVFLTLALSSSLLLNFSFAVVVIVTKSFHEKEMIISMVLTVSNACYSVVAFSFRIASVATGGWPLGKPLCNAAGTITLFFALSRYAILLAITVDRFGSIAFPFRYPRHSTKVEVAILAVGSLYLALVVLGFNANIIACYNFDEAAQICTIRLNSCKTMWCRVYGTFQLFTLLFFGVVAPLVLNAAVFYNARKHRKAIRGATKCGTVNNVNMVDHGASEMKSQETRALVTMALLISSITIFPLPFIMRSILQSNHYAVSLIASVLITNLYLLIPTVDGLMMWRNRDMKERIEFVRRKVHACYMN